MRLSLIVAIDALRGMGYANQLLCHLPADLARFKKITMGKPIIMGRKTFESIGRPLPGRLNIVISRTLSHIEGAVVVDSFADALLKAGAADEIMIIGGAEIFQIALPKADYIYLTHIKHSFAADVFFPELSIKDWQCVGEEFRPHDENNPYDITFKNYQRISK